MITTGNVAPTSASQVLVTVPPGVSTVAVSNTSGVTVYVSGGFNDATAGNGFAIPNGAPPVTFPGYPGSAGTPLNVIAPTGSVTGVVSWALSVPR